jgi:phosphomethylpyrimidine synthase
MKITEDVRRYATEKRIRADEALEAGMKEMAQEFLESGGEVYR